MCPSRASAMAMIAPTPSPARAWVTRAPTARERVAVPMPRRPVRAQRPSTVKVWNSTPGGTSVMSRAPGIDVVRAHGIGIRPLHGPPLREAAKAEGLDVHGLGAPLDHQLRHALAHRGGDLEAGAAERGGEVQAVDAVHAPENRMAI